MDTTQTVSPATTLRLELKPERVQEGLTALTAPNAALTIELTLYSPQPVTAEVEETKVAILIHKDSEPAVAAA